MQQAAETASSLLVPEGLTADAWATAFMVMGRKRAIRKLEQIRELDAFLIYSTENGIETFSTNGIKPMVSINP